MKPKSSIILILIIFCALFMISGVSASDNETYHSFSELNQSIADSGNDLDLQYDYKFDGTVINIDKTQNFTINGNNHVINKPDIFNFNSTGVVIVNDLTFKNCVNTRINVSSSVVFNNVKFINCSGNNEDMELESLEANRFILTFANTTFNNCIFENCSDTTIAFHAPAVFNNIDFINCSSHYEDGEYNILGLNHFISIKSNVTFDKCRFFMAKGDYIPILVDEKYNLVIKNSLFENGSFTSGCIYANRAGLIIENSIFNNFNSTMATAINYKGWNFTLRNSKFVNLSSDGSGGAILIKYFPNLISNDTKILPNDPFLIENCVFINTSAIGDGGAIHLDMDSGSRNKIQTLNLINCTFTDCKSNFGGAVSDLGGFVNITNSKFSNNHAGFKGGAIYTSWATVNITDCVLTNNSARKTAGAIYFDKKKLTIVNSNLTDNKVNETSETYANCIFIYDGSVHFVNSTFDNGGVGVYADFAGDSKFENVTKNEDIFLMNNKNYMISVENK